MSEIEDMKKVLDSYNKARATIKSKNEELRYATISVQESLKKKDKEILQLNTRIKAEKEKLESSVETPFEQYRREIAQEPKDDRFEQEVRKAQQEKIKNMEQEVKKAQEDKAQQEKESKEKVESAEKRLQERKQQLMNGVASQENIITVNKGLRSLDSEIRKKQIELSKKELEVQEYFNDIEEGKKNKNILDLYKEVDTIKGEIRKLESDKDKYTRFLDVLKSIRDKSMEKQIQAMNQAIARPQIVQKVIPQEQTEPKKEEAKNETVGEQTESKKEETKNGTVEEQTNLTPEQIEAMKAMQQEMQNGFNVRDAKNVQFPTEEELTEPASVTTSENKTAISNIKIDARNGRVEVLIDNGKGGQKQEISLQDAVKNKKEILKSMKIKQKIGEYCEKNDIGFFGKLKLRRSINPVVVEAMQLYGDENQLNNYIQSLGGTEKLGFALHYNLKEADETSESFKLMNKLAKRNKDIEGVTAEGIKESLWDKLVNRVKQGRMPAPEEVKALDSGEEKQADTTRVTESAHKQFAKENEVSEEVKQNISKVEEKAQAENNQGQAQQTSQEKTSEAEL